MSTKTSLLLNYYLSKWIGGIVTLSSLKRKEKEHKGKTKKQCSFRPSGTSSHVHPHVKRTTSIMSLLRFKE